MGCASLPRVRGTVLALGLLLAGPTAQAASAGVTEVSLSLPQRHHQGVASWYGGRHQGRKTASGEIFSIAKRTAAHRSLPLGTVIRVTNLDNGRHCLVRVNDRGPYVEGRILDLSEQAARDIGMHEAGTALVRIDVVKNDRN